MGAIYMILSSLLFVLEIVLQIYTVTWYSDSSRTVFLTLLVLVMGPLIIVNFISAILVTRTQDFAGKRCGRAICIAFHVLQMGMVWRSLKVLILYDDKDWLEYVNLRLVHCGFQSLPFSVIVAYTMFVNNQAEAEQIVCITASVSSSSLSLTVYRLGTAVYQSEEFETLAKKVSTMGGVVLLFASTLLLLLSRCTSIVLFTLVHSYWIILPLGLHFIIYLLSRLIRQSCEHKVSFVSVVKAFHMSFINIFDLVGRDCKGLKCSYVVFYAAMLVENIIMSATWMLTSNYGDNFKLMTIMCVMVSFIVGIIAKYTGCGCVYDLGPGIMSDAFTNPELKTVLGIERTQSADENDIAIHHNHSVDISHDSPITSLHYQHSHIPDVNCPSHSSSSADTQRDVSHSSGEKNPSRRDSSGETRRSRHDNNSKIRRSRVGSAASTSKRIQQYENRAFEKSQGNIIEDRHKYISAENSHMHDRLQTNVLPVTDGDSKLRYVSGQNVTRISNDELASSISRNTHTLRSSQLVYSNGFEDPFRERGKSRARRKRLTAQDRLHYKQNKIDVNFIKHYLHSPSVDSSDTCIYPYASSDTSSSMYYTHTKSRQRNGNKPMPMPHEMKANDGYSTDVSNSDYLSLNEYSVDDSSSWTETSDSDYALTWPPSNTSNLLTNYGISDKVSSEENVLHWLDMVDQNESISDSSFSTVMQNFSIPDDATDISMSGLQKFEVKTKQDKKSFKSFIPTPKGIFVKFRSLNYKGKRKPPIESTFVPDRQSIRNKPAHGIPHTGDIIIAETQINNTPSTRIIPFNDRRMSEKYIDNRHAKQTFEEMQTPHAIVTNDRTSPFENSIVSLKQYNNVVTQGKSSTKNSRRSKSKDTHVRDQRHGGELNTSTDTYSRTNINERHINAKYRQGMSASSQYCSNKSIDKRESHNMHYHRNSPYTDARRLSNVQHKHMFNDRIELTGYPTSFGDQNSQPSHGQSLNIHTSVPESVV